MDLFKNNNLSLSLSFFFSFKNFDNLDGKQARKTGNSSPMGLLFDHGCDSLTVNIQGVSLAHCMGFGNTYLSYCVYLSGAIPFFLTTLEEVKQKLILFSFNIYNKINTLTLSLCKND